MGWTRSGRTYTLTGSGGIVHAAVCGYHQPSTFEFAALLPTTVNSAAMFVFGSGDGRWCYWARIIGANVVIQKRTAGGAASTVTNGADDTPASVPCTIAHGLTPGSPVVLAVRVIDRAVIEVYINGVRKLAHTPTDTTLLANLWLGLAGDTDGTSVSRAKVCDLVPVNDPQKDVLVVIGGGEVWMAESEDGIARIAQGAVKADGLVSAVDFEQEALIVDGASARILDPADRTVTAWTPTLGDLPGSTGPGRTYASVIENHFARALLNDSVADLQNLTGSRVYDRDDYELGTGEPAGAWSMTAVQTARVGQAIIGFKSAGTGSLIIGCVSSLWRLAGDPTGPLALDVVSTDTGVISKDCFWVTDGDKILAHTRAGFGFIVGRSFVNLSLPVLTEIVRVPVTDARCSPIVIRDPNAQGVHIFMSRANATTPATHLFYDERVGNFTPAAGGFYPETYPLEMEPMAATIWRGRMVFICRDGYVREFDKTQSTDDGTAIPVSLPLALFADGDQQYEHTLLELEITAGDDAGAFEVELWTGQTAQEAYSGAGRRMAWSKTCGPGRTRIGRTARAPAMVAVITSEAADGNFSIEEIQRTFVREPRTHRRRAATAPPTIAAAVVATPTTDFDAGPGGGGTVTADAGAALVYERPADELLAETSFENILTSSDGGAGNPTYPGYGDSDGSVAEF
jgi:hypothetical protein